MGSSVAVSNTVIDASVVSLASREVPFRHSGVRVPFDGNGHAALALIIEDRFKRRFEFQIFKA